MNLNVKLGPLAIIRRSTKVILDKRFQHRFQVQFQWLKWGKSTVLLSSHAKSYDSSDRFEKSGEKRVELEWTADSANMTE